MESSEQNTSIVDNLVTGEGGVIDQEAVKQGTMGYMKEGAMTTEQGMGTDAAVAAFKAIPPAQEESAPVPSDAPTSTMTNSVAEPTGTQDGSLILGEGAVIDHEALKDGSATLTSPEAMVKLSEEPSEEAKQKLQAQIADTGKPKDDPSIIPEPKPEPEPVPKESSESKEAGNEPESSVTREKVDGEEKVHALLGNSDEPPSEPNENGQVGEGEDLESELKNDSAGATAIPKKTEQEPLTKGDIMEGYSGEVGPRGMPVEIKKQLLDETELTPPSQSSIDVNNNAGTTSASKADTTTPEATTDEGASDKGMLANSKNAVSGKAHQTHAHKPSLLGKLKALKGKLTGSQDKKA